jgi:hypothetical protein
MSRIILSISLGVLASNLAFEVLGTFLMNVMISLGLQCLTETINHVPLERSRPTRDDDLVDAQFDLFQFFNAVNLQLRTT